MEKRLQQDLENIYNLIESQLDTNKVREDWLDEVREKIKKFSNFIVI
jgi:DNA-binding transcriptional regulator GbsR (MarR family)